MNFLYTIIFSFVPRKAILGRSQVAVTLLAVSFFSLAISFLLWIEYYASIRLLNLYFFVIIFAVLFVSFRLYFLRSGRLRKNLKIYESKSKWKLKLLGIVFFVLSMLSQIISMVVLTILKDS